MINHKMASSGISEKHQEMIAEGFTWLIERASKCLSRRCPFCAPGNGFFSPTSFQGYAKKNGLTAPRTAEHIFVDYLERLNPLLRREQAMVLMLRAAVDGPGTQFAVVKTPNRDSGME